MSDILWQFLPGMSDTNRLTVRHAFLKGHLKVALCGIYTISKRGWISTRAGIEERVPCKRCVRIILEREKMLEDSELAPVIDIRIRLPRP